MPDMDGFGNLLAQTVTKGSAPSLSVLVSGTTNRITSTGYSYDSNGNLTAAPGLTMTYDVENRMVSVTRSGVGIEQYVYNPRGERVWQRLYKTGWSQWQERVFFWGAEGNHLLTLSGTSTYKNVYFGGRQVYRSYIGSSGTVIQDRLGSAVRQYFPYGDEPTTTTQDRVKFATYFRDEVSTLDYARNRYYSSTIARFTTADPYQASGGPADPQSWNRYAYVQGDPVNFGDPVGLGRCPAGTENTCIEVIATYLYMGGGGGGEWYAGPVDLLLDPVGPASAAPYQPDPSGVAGALRNGVISTPGYTNCEALTDFASAMAAQSNIDFVRSFGVLTPSQPASNATAVFTSSAAVSLYNGGDNGFQAQFQNTVPDTANGNGDQAHHFAAFFQLGYSYGFEAAAGAAYAFEMAEAGWFTPPTPFRPWVPQGFLNVGDIWLGVAAARIGSDLKSGAISTSDVAMRISQLCQH